MDERQALSAFAALSQETRLRILRHLVIAGPDGIAAGAIAGKVEVSASNVSFHLKELERAGLVSVRRDSRSMVYSAEYEALSGLIRFLMEDCCSGRPEICAPALAPGCRAADAQEAAQ
ncbi:MAG: ArsR family transcriptional regulator [Mesorhizobium sp.]|nr:ArsR family transcriptional regulator [Mesorhizobium sp. M8A.F.Ca.ET.023.01.1.1]RWC75220.1 MAG: ArsR family transcriptional regulator [Mesorhizobium sp.]